MGAVWSSSYSKLKHISIDIRAFTTAQGFYARIVVYQPLFGVLDCRSGDVRRGEQCV